jgi:hypothetical protein
MGARMMYALCPACSDPSAHAYHSPYCAHHPDTWLAFEAICDEERHDAVTPARHDAETPVDAINPSHYRAHPSGVECIAITEHMGFNLGNAVKYVWRADLKHASPLDDLRKARWYLDREIAKLEKAGA